MWNPLFRPLVTPASNTKLWKSQSTIQRREHRTSFRKLLIQRPLEIHTTIPLAAAHAKSLVQHAEPFTTCVSKFQQVRSSRFDDGPHRRHFRP